MLPLIRSRPGRARPRPPDWRAAFGREAPLEVDLGCGRGHFALERARANPDIHVIALDTKGKWIAAIRRQAERDGLRNLRAIRCDASFDLPLLFGPASVAGFTLLHPDPWWKKRHRKRRLIQAGLVAQLGGMLQPGGFLYAQTDVPDLAAEIAEIVSACPSFQQTDAERLLAERLGRIQSHRAQKCARLGIPVSRVAFTRVAS